MIKTFILLVTGLSLMVGCSPVSFDVDGNAVCEGLDAQYCNPINPSVGEYRTDYRVPTPKVDILILNDNSGTMEQDQIKMGQRFNDFISKLAGLNWQLGITTMDISDSNRRMYGETPINPPYQTPNPNLQDGKLIPFSNGSYVLKEGDYNAAAMFYSAIRVTTRGLYDERGILAASMALENGYSTGLIRSDSTHVALVMLTDEDVRSVGDIYPVPPSLRGFEVQARDRKEHLESIWNQVNANKKKTISVHSLIVKPGDASCLNQRRTTGIFNDANYGRMYADLSNDPKFEGSIGSVCSTNYTHELRRMGDFIAGRTQGDIPLVSSCDIIKNDPERPITITVNGASFRLGLDPIPSRFTEVEAFPGRISFTPGVNAGDRVMVHFFCNR